MARKGTPEYPPEFRAEVVRLVREGGRQVSAADSKRSDTITVAKTVQT